MCYNLMSKELEDTRLIFFSTCCATENVDVELLRFFQIINRKGKMERAEFFWRRVIGSTTPTYVVFIPIALPNAT